MYRRIKKKMWGGKSPIPSQTNWADSHHRSDSLFCKKFVDLVANGEADWNIVLSCSTPAQPPVRTARDLQILC